MAEQVASLEGPDWYCIRCGALVTDPWTNWTGHVYCSVKCADDDSIEEPGRIRHMVDEGEDFGGRY